MIYYLTPQQYAVLDVLIDNAEPEGISPKTLAKQCSCKPSSMQSVISELQSIGLVFKRYGVDLYVPVPEAISGMKDGTVQVATDEQIQKQVQSLGAKIKSALAQSSLTREDVAEALGIPWSAMYDYERGKRRMPLQYLRRFAQIMHYSLDYFLEEAA